MTLSFGASFEGSWRSDSSFQVSAGLVEDPRTMLKSMNSLLEQALEKH